MATVMSIALDRVATDVVRRDARVHLVELAREMSGRLDEGMYSWRRTVETLASLRQIRDPATDANDNRMTLDRLHQNYEEIAWIGMASTEGRVLVSANGVLEGVDVSTRPWFKAGLHAPYMGDVHEAKLLAAILPAPANGDPLRFVDVAAPVYGLDSQLRGVLGVHLAWSWARQVEDKVFSPERRARGVETFVLNREGHVLLAPPGLEASRMPTSLALAKDRIDGAELRWSSGDYATGAISTKGFGGAESLGWTVVVRQPVAAAYASARQLQAIVVTAGVAFALLFALFGVVLAGVLARPLTALIDVADRLRFGEETAQIPVTGFYREARRLGASLRHLVAALDGERRKLAALNASLEQQVLERTTLLDTANQHLFSVLGERDKLIGQLEQLANTDGLTGLLNRRALFARADIELRRVQRQGGQFSLILLDIDHFKRINDGYGHDVGDEALRQLAACLKQELRDMDVPARLGGEEFVILLSDGDMEAALALSERLRERVAALDIPTAKEPIRMTASFGVADWEKGLSVEDVISRADDALYRAKHAGRNRVYAWS